MTVTDRFVFAARGPAAAPRRRPGSRMTAADHLSAVLAARELAAAYAGAREAT